MSPAVVLFVALFVDSAPAADEGPLNLAFSKMAVFNEEPCSREGGVCLEVSECPKGKLADKRGLCPEQRKRDVECCFTVGRSVKTCQGLGGLCRKDCPANLILKGAEDCGDEGCCALV